MKKGFIALISVLIVGAIGTAIAVSLLLLGIGTSRTSFALLQSTEARALADACSEEALQKIRDFLPYSGSGSLTTSQGSCTYTVTKGSGQNRTVTSTGTVGTIVRKVKITLTQINPQIITSSWQEVADF